MSGLSGWADWLKYWIAIIWTNILNKEDQAWSIDAITYDNILSYDMQYSMIFFNLRSQSISSIQISLTLRLKSNLLLLRCMDERCCCILKWRTSFPLCCFLWPDDYKVPYLGLIRLKCFTEKSVAWESRWSHASLVLAASGSCSASLPRMRMWEWLDSFQQGSTLNTHKRWKRKSKRKIRVMLKPFWRLI